MNCIKIPYEILIRFNAVGEFSGAHQQFREVIVDQDGVSVLAEKLLPALAFGTDPDFPAGTLLTTTLESALKDVTSSKASALVAQEAAALANSQRDESRNERDEARAERDAAIAERQSAEAARDTALAELAELKLPSNSPAPERLPGKWWSNSSDFLEEFTPEETLAISRSNVPLIAKLLMTLLTWRGEIWSSDERLVQGLGALKALGILTEERHAAILA
jgi:hypothetical protein